MYKIYNTKLLFYLFSFAIFGNCVPSRYSDRVLSVRKDVSFFVIRDQGLVEMNWKIISIAENFQFFKRWITLFSSILKWWFIILKEFEFLWRSCNFPGLGQIYMVRSFPGIYLDRQDGGQVVCIGYFFVVDCSWKSPHLQLLF